MSARLLLDAELEPVLRVAGLRTAHDLLGLGGEGRERSYGAFVDLPVAGTVGRFYVKRYRYAGWREARGLLGRGTLWGTAPCVNEFRALTWLREHDLPAVRPVAAASVRQFGRLVGHGLLTEAVPETCALDARLATPGDPLRESPHLRSELAEDLGRVLARMHRLGFAHRDCHARNILVRVRSGRAGFWLLDCRRGGVSRRRSGSLFDLACLDHDVVGVATNAERRRALAAYLDRAGGARDVLRRLRAIRMGLPPPRRPAGADTP